MEMARIQAEMSEIMAAEKKSQAVLEAAFRGIGYAI
jgi:type I restriction enzyme M protein